MEEAFRNLKGDLAIRPVFHRDEKRIEAYIFIAFLAYCLQITLTRRLHKLAPGLTARSALAKLAAVQMIDVHLPTTDGREIILTRTTEPEPDLRLLIDRMKLQLPAQPPPKKTPPPRSRPNPSCSEDPFRQGVDFLDAHPKKSPNPRRRVRIADWRRRDSRTPSRCHRRTARECCSL